VHGNKLAIAPARLPTGSGALLGAASQRIVRIVDRAAAQSLPITDPDRARTVTASCTLVAPRARDESRRDAVHADRAARPRRDRRTFHRSLLRAVA
jgi:hypothetical protein